mmetsp:Transcript_33367/g.93635  ORF Transcript_33367/g.93635 Transcript_33367/m.93635 type:complete len:141 (-) Transcript_33367:193-615(-)
MGRKARADDSSESEDDGKHRARRRKDDKKKEEKKKRSRSRSRGKERRKSRPRSAGRGRSASSSSAKSSDDEEEMKEFLLSTDMPEDQMLVKMMGFSAFDSTKGKDHSGSDLSDVKRATKRQYRQYMNRRGGFNRPLDAAF